MVIRKADEGGLLSFLHQQDVFIALSSLGDSGIFYSSGNQHIPHFSVDYPHCVIDLRPFSSCKKRTLWGVEETLSKYVLFTWHTKDPNAHGYIKAFPMWGSEGWQNSLLVCMWVLTVYVKSIDHSFLLWYDWSLRLLLYRDPHQNLLNLLHSAVYRSLTSVVQMYKLNTEVLVFCWCSWNISTRLPGPPKPTYFVYRSFYVSVSLSVCLCLSLIYR